MCKIHTFKGHVSVDKSMLPNYTKSIVKVEHVIRNNEPETVVRIDEHKISYKIYGRIPNFRIDMLTKCVRENESFVCDKFGKFTFTCQMSFGVLASIDSFGQISYYLQDWIEYDVTAIIPVDIA